MKGEGENDTYIIGSEESRVYFNRKKEKKKENKQLLEPPERDNI